MQGWADGVGGGGVHGRGGVDEEVEEGEAAVARQARSREIDLDEYEKSVYRFGRKVAEGEVGAGRGGEGVTHTRGGGGLEVEGRGEGPRKGPLTRGELEQEIKILRRQLPPPCLSLSHVLSLCNIHAFPMFFLFGKLSDI